MAKVKGTFQPRTTRKRLRVHGFFARVKNGSRILQLRRLKGRKRLTVG